MVGDLDHVRRLDRYINWRSCKTQRGKSLIGVLPYRLTSQNEKKQTDGFL